MKKFLTACVLTVISMPSFSYNATAVEQKLLYNLIEESLYFDNITHTYIQALGESMGRYTPLEKPYNPYLPSYHACLVNTFSTPANYQQVIHQGIDQYLKQVDKKQFKSDLKFLTQLNQSKTFTHYKNYSAMMAVEGEKLLTHPFEFRIPNQKYNPTAVLPNVHEKVFSTLFDEPNRQPLSQLLGSIDTNQTVMNSMVTFHQKIRDNCHQSFWDYKQKSREEMEGQLREKNIAQKNEFKN